MLRCEVCHSPIILTVFEAPRFEHIPNGEKILLTSHAGCPVCLTEVITSQDPPHLIDPEWQKAIAYYYNQEATKHD